MCRSECWCVESDDSEASVWVQFWHGPYDGAAPVVSAEYGFVDAFCVEHLYEVVAEVLYGVLGVVCGSAGEST